MDKNKPLEFKSNSKPLLFIIFLFNVVLFLISILHHSGLKNSLFVIALFNLTMLLYFFLKKHVLLIIFEKEMLFIEFWQMLKKKKIAYPYSLLRYSYEKGLIGRGLTDHILVLYDENGRRLFSIHPATSTFGDKDVKAILEAVKEKKITLLARS